MCFQPPRIPKHRLLNERDYSNPLFQRRRRGSSPLLRWSLFIVTVFVAFVFVAESTRAATEHILEPEAAPSPFDSKAGQLFIRSDNGSSQPALLLNSKVAFSVSGMVLHTTFSQSFQNPSKDQWAEGIYVFPLPDKAAISHMEMRIGERTIVGKIKEKQAAKKQYQKAKAAGKRVALIEQERPNMFTQNVANIGPGEEVTITLKYQDTVHFDAGRFSFRFPMTITPRFMPSGQTPTTDPLSLDHLETEKPLSEVRTATQMVLDNTRPWGWSAPTALVPDAHRISPPQRPNSNKLNTASHQIQLSVTLDAGLPLQTISSPYHDLVIEKKRLRHFVSTRETHIPMDRDFELQWQPVAQKIPSAAAFTETLIEKPAEENGVTRTESSPTSSNKENINNSHEYALLMLLPPQQQNSARLARDVIFIVDTSGSMGGNSIRQAKQSLTMALQRLTRHDQFNVIEFNSNHRSLFSTSQPVNDQSRAQALGFVAQLQAGGGTNMAPALNTALSASNSETHLRQIVFITDGSVGNEAQLFKLIHQKLGQARLFTVAIGSAPNSFFMRKSAQFGRGTFTHIGEQQEVAEKMSTLFKKLESPVLRNLSVNWPEGLNVEAWPQQLPDLYHGEPILIKAKFSSEMSDNKTARTVTLQGDLGGTPWQQQLTLANPTLADSKSNATHHQGIAKLWAREKIAALLDEKTRGATEAEVKPKVLDVALRHQLMSPYTSFIAEDKTPVRPVEKHVDSQLVPNLTPKGQKTLAYPSTSTAAPLNVALGFIALLLLLGQRMYHKRNAQGVAR